MYMYQLICTYTVILLLLDKFFNDNFDKILHGFFIKKVIYMKEIFS